MKRPRRDVERVWSDAPEPEATEASPADPGPDRPVRVGLSTKGRRGKAVTVVEGLPDGEGAAIAKRLRKACGTGGSFKGGVAEVQGDHREKVAELLGERFEVRPL